MALYKPIEQENGLTLSYHRIFFIEQTINDHIAIVVSSYLDQASREKEKAGGSIYNICVTYNRDYVEDMTVKQAYEYLKTLDDFKGATDVLEEEDDSNG